MATKTECHGSKNADQIEEEVKLTAELIFDFLYREGELEMESLRQKINHRVPFFDWGLGWLVGKGDIEIKGDDGAFRVCRKGPTPVIIPLRGN